MIEMFEESQYIWDIIMTVSSNLLGDPSFYKINNFSFKVSVPDEDYS